MTTREALAFCRVCGAACGVRLTVEDDRIATVQGDKQHAMTTGYVCIKGLQAQAQYYGPQRLLHPMKRDAGGQFHRIGLEQALDEIAGHLRQIIDRHGAEAVAAFCGSSGSLNALAMPALTGWMQAIGSPARYSSLTIDQSAKFIANFRLGFWSAGPLPFAGADGWLLIGSNPLVSVNGLAGFNALNPTQRLREARARGMKLIVIDPRRTEMTKHADLHLQIKAGEDVSMAGGLLHIILNEGWHDEAFCAAHVDGLDRLREAVSVFTPARVAQRTGVPAELLVQAARLYAVECRRAGMTTGTGPSMGPHSNLAEHLYACLPIVCGRFPRAGERVSNPGVLNPQRPRMAQVVRPRRPWERGPKNRAGQGTLLGEMMSGRLAEEMLTPGPGQIRALISEGGNPVSALPDLEKTVRAFSSLDLLVAIDPYLTNTSRLAHYILPPKLPYERHDLPFLYYETVMYPEPFVQYCEPVVPVPAGAEVIDDWYFYWATAKRLGLALTIDGVTLDMDAPPSSEELAALLVRRGSIPFDELRRSTGGKCIDLAPQYVEVPDPASKAKFDLLPVDVSQELNDALETMNDECEDKAFPFRLAARRMRDVFNSACRDLPAIARRVPCNPIHIHPQDLDRLGLRDGDPARIESEHGAVQATVESDDTMKPGVVSMTHGWGGLSADASSDEPGTNVNALISSERHVEKLNAMPRFSGIPVRIRAV